MLNERVVREDILTSVHVDEYSLEVRETKRGMEELTSDIPNVSEDATKDLDVVLFVSELRLIPEIL